MSALLTIELVPRTCWYANVRSEVSQFEWALCKRFVSQRSGYACEICGGRGPEWPVECHEVWEYDDHAHVQRLAGLIALCPSCHRVKHIGRTEAVGGLDGLLEALEHLMAVNEWTPEQAEECVQKAFELWEQRSRHQWTLDISYLQQVPGWPT